MTGDKRACSMYGINAIKILTGKPTGKKQL